MGNALFLCYTGYLMESVFTVLRITNARPNAQWLMFTKHGSAIRNINKEQAKYISPLLAPLFPFKPF